MIIWDNCYKKKRILCFLDGKLCKKKKSQPSNIRNKEHQQEVSVNMQMCCGWTMRNFWLLPNEVSANTVCMPTSPFPSSKLFSEVLHTNGEELKSLSFKKCCAALNIRYKPLRSAKQKRYNLLYDCTTRDQGCGWRGRQAFGAALYQTH